jgi:hypothetical protein
MTNIIIAKGDPHDPDKPKDCSDFVPLNDGTQRGDRKYCDRSKECKQYDPDRCIGYYSEWHEYFEFFMDADGKIQREPVHDYLCTGNFPIWEERSEEEKAH